MDRWARLLPVHGALLPERAPPAVVGTDPPRGPLSHRLAGLTGLISQEPIPELRVITMGVEQGVGPASLHQLGIGHRISKPAVVEG